MRELVSGEIEFVSGGLFAEASSSSNSVGGGVCTSSNPWGTNAMPPQLALNMNASSGGNVNPVRAGFCVVGGVVAIGGLMTVDAATLGVASLPVAGAIADVGVSTYDCATAFGS